MARSRATHVLRQSSARTQPVHPRVRERAATAAFGGTSHATFGARVAAEFCQRILCRGDAPDSSLVPMRIALTLLLALHGTIHLLGFLAWSRLVAIRGLSGRTLVPLSASGMRGYALLWLAATLVLLAAAALWFGRHAEWWLPALLGVLLSQCLIVFAWHDARYGTIVNLMLLVVALVGLANVRFTRHTDAEVRALLALSSPRQSPTIRGLELQHLPPPVRRWLEASGIVGGERARTVRLRQRGELRTSPDGAWMPARADQYFSVEPPAFVWKVDTAMMGLLPVAGRDKYAGGRGHMLIKALSLIDVVDSADEKIDHGSLLRFLGETVWFPSAALAPYVVWEPIDETTARATMRHGGLHASAVFTFSDDGRVLGLSAERYLGGGTGAKLTPWSVSFSEWRKFQGIEIPDRGQVSWMLASGAFTYYRWEILEVEFNRAELYEHPS